MEEPTYSVIVDLDVRRAILDQVPTISIFPVSTLRHVVSRILWSRLEQLLEPGDVLFNLSPQHEDDFVEETTISLQISLHVY